MHVAHNDLECQTESGFGILMIVGVLTLYGPCSFRLYLSTASFNMSEVHTCRVKKKGLEWLCTVLSVLLLREPLGVFYIVLSS